MVRRAPRKEAKSEKARPARNPAFRKFLLFTIALTLAVVGLNALAHINYFRVQDVTVTGNGHETAGAVISVTGLDQAPPMIDVDSIALTKRAQSLRWIESITAVRHWPHGVTLNVRERQPVAVASDDSGALYLVDRGGHQLDPPALGTNLPRLQVRGTTTGWPFRNWARPAARVAATLPIAFGRQVAVISIDRHGVVRLQMTTPVSFVLGTTENLHDKYVAVAAVIAHQVLTPGSIVDVSVPSAVTIQAG